MTYAAQHTSPSGLGDLHSVQAPQLLPLRFRKQAEFENDGFGTAVVGEVGVERIVPHYSAAKFLAWLFLGKWRLENKGAGAKRGE